MVEIGAKLSTKLIEKTISEVGRDQHLTQQPGEGASFKDVLGAMDNGSDFASQLCLNNNELGLSQQGLDAMSASNIQINPESIQVGAGSPDGMSKVVGLLSEVNDGHNQMQGMMNQILYGGTKFSNQELLAIQAHVFHHAQMTELVVKAADQGVSSIKSVLNTNIQ